MINVFLGCVMWKAIWCGLKRNFLLLVTFSSTVKKWPLVLYPNRSLVVNKGFDKEATNTKKSNYYQKTTKDLIEITFPSKVKFNSDTFETVSRYIKSKNNDNLITWLLKKINFYRW